MLDGTFMHPSSYSFLIEMEIPLRLLPRFPGRRQRDLRLLLSISSSSKAAARQGDGASAVVTAVCSSSVTNAPLVLPQQVGKVEGVLGVHLLQSESLALIQNSCYSH